MNENSDGLGPMPEEQVQRILKKAKGEVPLDCGLYLQPDNPAFVQWWDATFEGAAVHGNRDAKLAARLAWESATERAAMVCVRTAADQLRRRDEADDDEEADVYCHAAGVLEECAKTIRGG